MSTDTFGTDAPMTPAPRQATDLSDRRISEELVFRCCSTMAVAGFPPESWDAGEIDQLTQVINRLREESAEADREVQVYNLATFLRERAHGRDRSNPQLLNFDIADARKHFGAKARDRNARQNGNKNGQAQNILVSSAFISSTTTGSRKRHRESSEDSQVMKSARRDESANIGGLAFMSPAKTMMPAGSLFDLVEPVEGETLLSSSMLDMIGTVENLKAASRAILNRLTHKLDNARSSMEGRETLLDGMLSSRVNPRTLEELRRSRDNMIAEKKEIEKAKAFFEQHQGGMALDPFVISQASEQHKAKLRECDKGIAQAEAKFQDMEDALTDNVPLRDKLQSQLDQNKAEVTRLERRKEQSELEVDYYRTIEGLMKLGPRGLAALAKKLARSRISVPMMADNAEMENQTLIDLTT